jgi:hypothetical protein
MRRKEIAMSNEKEKAGEDLKAAEKDLEKGDLAEAEKEAKDAVRAIEAARKKEEIDVSISTTSGFYPAEGFNRLPEKQIVQEELDRAKHALHIKDVAGWVATVITPGGKREINPAKSYVENGLSDKAEIDWGPSEGGGG